MKKTFTLLGILFAFVYGMLTFGNAVSTEVCSPSKKDTQNPCSPPESMVVSAEVDAPPKKDGQLPEIKLAVPQDSAQRNYLGLSNTMKFFTIPQIKADVVIIEAFSMYCPHCQSDAPRVNELFKLVESDQNLKHTIKLIGIGVGNSTYEVDLFKKTYDIPFPLFPDGDFTIHKQLGEVRTPYFIGVKIENDGTHHIFYSRLGGFETAEEFLKLIVNLSTVK